MESLRLRQADYDYVIDCVQSGASCSIIGLSNTGKSMLLRDLATCAQDCEQTFVYIDCNRMLAATDQGFYEAILRALQETLARIGVSADVMTRLADCYRQAVQAENPFLVPLGFNDAIMLACQTLVGGVVLLLDEFDEAYATLDSRVFLNLRALHDRYRGNLLYVTATVRALRAIQSNATYGEFYELVSHHERYLGMLSRPDASALIHSLAKRSGAQLDDEETEYVWQQAGGHPGLLAAVVQPLIDLEAGAPELYRQQGLTLVTQRLDQSELAQAECVKLWHQLSEEEREELTALIADGEGAVSSTALNALQRKGIITGGQRPRLFAERFAAFVRRRRRTELDYPEGIWIDIDAGDVWVEGERVATLTELEYRLLQTLYGRMGKLCDKYLIVESVWGQEYLDTVDDARIEKLISRLRSKIEPDPSRPRYLITIRGRGYKLLQHPAREIDDS
jgi:DNA-binding winged helix-turn-helix (wHTH) protein